MDVFVCSFSFFIYEKFVGIFLKIKKSLGNVYNCICIIIIIFNDKIFESKNKVLCYIFLKINFYIY